MSIEIKISKNRIPYKKAMIILEKRVDDVKKGLKKRVYMGFRTPHYIYWWY